MRARPLSAMKFSIFQDSRIGGRPLNEDRLGYRYTSEALVMVVADGLGGHGYGEIAAEAAVRSIIANFDRKARPRLDDSAMFLADALAGAHDAVCAIARLRQLAEQPRTTIVACIIQDDIALWGHAGDSRLYLLRNGRILVRTHDHSHVQTLIDAGRIDATQALTHPGRHTLTSCLGSGTPPRFEFSARTPLAHHDMLLLCSDGVWGPLGDDQALTGITTGDLIQTVPALLDQVDSAGGSRRDNLSMIAMRWEDARRTDGRPTSSQLRNWSQEDFHRTLNTTHTHLHTKET